jgi:hypothetical protein
VLQARELDNEGHAAPPAEAEVTTDLVRLWDPLSQVKEQEDQAPQPETLQSRGHSCVLQFCDSINVGQATPPCWGGVVTDREWLWEPDPQVLEQTPQALKSDTAQFTGQGWMLQAT